MRLFYLIIAFSLPITVWTQVEKDHLVPESSVFNVYNYRYDYYSIVRSKLFNGLHDRPIVRYQRMPSFSGENVFDIYETEEGIYEIVYHECRKSIWYNKDEEVVINKFKKEISKYEVDLIVKLYKEAIDKTKYPDNNKLGFDGTTYRFGYDSGGGLRTGKAWSPKSVSCIGELVLISNEIIRNLKIVNNNSILMDNLEKEILNLIARLNSN